MTAILTDERGHPAPSRPARLLGDAAAPLAFFALSRLVTLVAAVVAGIAHPGFTVVEFFSAWDGGWYLEVVRHGYPAAVPEIAGTATESTHAFFPLFPLAVRGVSWVLGGSDAVAGIVVSLLFGAVCAVLVHRLAGALVDRATAERATALFCLFPGSLVLSMVYAESMLLALAAACLLALIRRQWVLAGLAAGLATACRPNAIALVAACAWQSVVAIRERREWRSLAAPLLAPIGILAFFSYLWLRTGEPGAWFRAQSEGWGQQPGLVRPIVDLVAGLVRSGFTDLHLVIIGLSVVFAAVTLILLLHRRWPGVFTVYTILVLALSITSRMDGLRPRFVLTAFPLFIALAHVTRKRAYWFLLGASTLGLLVLALLHNTFILHEP